MEQSLQTWTNNQAEEDLMNDDHTPFWNQMIKLVPHALWHNKCVLDFGCNQGGFLKLLHNTAPYKSAIGIDLAEASLEMARVRHTNTPTTFCTPSFLSQHQKSFDIAFSHEVLYLLPNLKEHAQIIKQSLKPGGRYYAAIGCYTDQPLWEEWRKIISEYSNLPVMDYSLDDYANAFFDEGFSANIQPFRMSGFFPLFKENEYLPKITDTIRYYNTDKVLFEFIKPPQQEALLVKKN